MPVNPLESYAILVIDEVDVANRLAHCRDKTGSNLQASFRATGAGIFHIPAQGERWVARLIGRAWYLEQQLDTTDDHTYVLDHMLSGDTRVSGDTLHLVVVGANINGEPFGSTTYSAFTGDGLTTVFTLDDVPVHKRTVQAFINGSLINPTGYSVLLSQVTFTVAPAAGPLVIYYQRVTPGAGYGVSTYGVAFYGE